MDPKAQVAKHLMLDGGGHLHSEQATQCGSEWYPGIYGIIATIKVPPEDSIRATLRNSRVARLAGGKRNLSHLMGLATPGHVLSSGSSG